MQNVNERREHSQNRDNRREEQRKEDSEPRNYRNPDPLNCSVEGKAMTVTLVNGRTESGTCMHMGAYFMEMKLPNGHAMIIAKSALVTVSIL
jgi:hypothetical protein